MGKENSMFVFSHIIIAGIRILFQSRSSIPLSVGENIVGNFLVLAIRDPSDPAELHLEMLILHFVVNDIDAAQGSVKNKLLQCVDIFLFGDILHLGRFLDELFAGHVFQFQLFHFSFCSLARFPHGAAEISL